MTKRFYRFSYLSPKEESRTLLPHQVRDGAAFAELAANLYSKGYTYGGLLLNYPARDPKVTNHVDTSFLDPSDLVVLTTRPPLDDHRYKDHKQIKRSHTSLEDEVFSIVRPHLDVSARSRIKLSRPRANELEKAAEYRNDNSGNRADIKFFSHAGSKHTGASYKEFKQYDDSVPYEIPGLADQNKTAVYLLHAQAAFKTGRDSSRRLGWVALRHWFGIISLGLGKISRNYWLPAFLLWENLPLAHCPKDPRISVSLRAGR